MFVPPGLNSLPVGVMTHSYDKLFAMTMTKDYDARDDANYVPEALKHKIPSDLKATNGHFPFIAETRAFIPHRKTPGQ